MDSSMEIFKQIHTFYNHYPSMDIIPIHPQKPLLHTMDSSMEIFKQIHTFYNHYSSMEKTKKSP
jgi:hypothetical protein